MAITPLSQRSSAERFRDATQPLVTLALFVYYLLECTNVKLAQGLTLRCCCTDRPTLFNVGARSLLFLLLTLFPRPKKAPRRGVKSARTTVGSRPRLLEQATNKRQFMDAGKLADLVFAKLNVD